MGLCTLELHANCAGDIINACHLPLPAGLVHENITDTRDEPGHLKQLELLRNELCDGCYGQMVLEKRVRQFDSTPHTFP